MVLVCRIYNLRLKPPLSCVEVELREGVQWGRSKFARQVMTAEQGDT